MGSGRLLEAPGSRSSLCGKYAHSLKAGAPTQQEASAQISLSVGTLVGDCRFLPPIPRKPFTHTALCMSKHVNLGLQQPV
eukprot:1156915-Pelagomonas_calceolata.AAC.6